VDRCTGFRECGRASIVRSSLARIAGSRRGRFAIGVASGALGLALAALAARHFTEASWPLSHGHPALLTAAGLLFLLAYAFKAYGWGRLFKAEERPQPLALAAANGGAAVGGVVLPGRFDELIRVAIVRRYPGCPAGVRTVCLSLFMLGLIDSVALAPLAFAASFPSYSVWTTTVLAIVAGAGIAAAALIIVLPRVAGTRQLLRFSAGRWLSPRTTTFRGASEAWALVSACWIVRALALFLLLGALGVGYSFTLALLFLCAGAAAAALPIGPAAAVLQVGAGAAMLVASGVGTSQAVAVALSVGALGVICGGAILLFAVGWRTCIWLAPAHASV
jgi:lysylphosphatidylglycerol synthase-like protein